MNSKLYKQPEHDDKQNKPLYSCFLLGGNNDLFLHSILKIHLTNSVKHTYRVKNIFFIVMYPSTGVNRKLSQKSLITREIN